MPISTRHRDDPPPVLDHLKGLAVVRRLDSEGMARLQERPEHVCKDRFEQGHRAYVALLDGEPAAWGWVATRTAAIGELGIRFSVPSGERYLWNFVTRPAFRGRGIYPRLLDCVVQIEGAEAERFWIIHAPENRASGSGIRKAGFTRSGEISFDAANQPAMAKAGSGGSDPEGFLDLPQADTPLAPCWRCVRAGRRWVMFCGPDACTCDYQAPAGGCGS